MRNADGSTTMRYYDMDIDKHDEFFFKFLRGDSLFFPNYMFYLQLFLHL